MSAAEAHYTQLVAAVTALMEQFPDGTFLIAATVSGASHMHTAGFGTAQLLEKALDCLVLDIDESVGQVAVVVQ